MTVARTPARFAIHDGRGFIGSECVSEDVDCVDLDLSRGTFRERRMRIDCGHGWALSVVFGSGTYLHGRDGWVEEPLTAEVAVLSPDGLEDLFEWGDTVMGYCTAEEVIRYVLKVRQHAAAEA